MVLFATIGGEVAMPLASVNALALVKAGRAGALLRADAGLVPGSATPGKTALAPEAGNENVTNAPLTGRPLASVTRTCTGCGKVVPISVPWGAPLTAAIAAGGPALKRTVTFAPALFGTARSICPSWLKSAATIEAGVDPAG